MMKRFGKVKRREAIMGFLFAGPWLAGFCIFTLYAIITVIYYSFTDFKVFAPPQWIGLSNYQELFIHDPLFYKSLSNTVYYVAFSVPLGIMVAFFLAELLNQRVRGMALFRTIFYLPSIVPIVASSMLWLWILNPNFGLLNAFLSKLGLPTPNWFGSPSWSKPALILMSLWGAGGTMIIFLAGLQDIPQQLYEAAELDGAGVFQKFSRITIPMMTPTIFFALIMGIIGGFQTFTQAFIMTQGGPAYSTLFYALYLYNNAFRYFKMGYASSQALVLFAIIMVLTIIVMSTSKRWVYYAGGR